MVTKSEAILWLDGLCDGALDLTADNIGLAKQVRSMLRPPEPEPQPPLPEGYLSPHFTLAEFTYSDTAKARAIDNTPDQAAVSRLTQLAQFTPEGIRKICGGHPVIISSGYRCAELNEAVGGASNSAHLYGCAADFTIPDFGDVLDICHALELHLLELGIDQLIDESGSGARWVHVGRAIPPSTAPRYQCLTIANGLTTTGFA
jgi:zinc D-Ala-D-Ala carboxypeptidase